MSLLREFIHDTTKRKDRNMKYTKDGCTTKVKADEFGNITISAVSGYNQNVDIVCYLEDNGNGYYVSVPSYSSSYPNHNFNLSYDELEYLYYAYKALRKEGKV